MNKWEREYQVMIPRRSGKRLTVIAKAMQLAKEGKKVAIFDIGGQVKVLEPLIEKDVFAQWKGGR